MAECDICGAEMTTGRSCTLVDLVVADRRRKRLPFGSETNRPASAKRCHDCGVSPGGVHHPGCSVEQCPVCEQQLFCCDCEKEEPRPVAN
jgi:hypothetical protein